MHLVRDLLDKQLIDINWMRMGRVDGLVMELPDGEQPRITTIAVGGTTLTERLPGFLARWSSAIIERWGVRKGAPFRIAWSHVTRVDTAVRVDFDADETAAMATSQWVRDRIIRHIPGA